MSNVLLLSRQSPPISLPNSASACRDLGPTFAEKDSEVQELVSFLLKKKECWGKSPEDFFASVSVDVEKYSDKLSALSGRIALRLRTREFYLCRMTWGQRGKTAFIEVLKRDEPEEGLSRIGYDKWMDFGGITNIISQSCISGTIVASCLSSLPDSKYRMVPQDAKNEKHREFLEDLRALKFQSLANQFAALEQALTTHISKKYSPLRKEPKKAPSYETLQDFSINPHNPQKSLDVSSGCDPFRAEPYPDLVITSPSQDLTLGSMGQNNIVGEQQQPFAEQETHWQTGPQQYEDIADQPSWRQSQQPQFLTQPSMNPLVLESIAQGFGASGDPMVLDMNFPADGQPTFLSEETRAASSLAAVGPGELPFNGTATSGSADFPLGISSTSTDVVASVMGGVWG